MELFFQVNSIYLDFGNVYMVERIELMQHTNETNEMLNDLKLEFFGGVTEDNITINKTTNDNLTINNITLDSSRRSTFVNITGISSYNPNIDNNGFSEIQVFGCYDGK